MITNETAEFGNELIARYCGFKWVKNVEGTIYVSTFSIPNPHQKDIWEPDYDYNQLMFAYEELEKNYQFDLFNCGQHGYQVQIRKNNMNIVVYNDMDMRDCLYLALVEMLTLIEKEQ